MNLVLQQPPKNWGSGLLHEKYASLWWRKSRLDGCAGRCCLRKWRSGDRGDPNLLKDRELAHPDWPNSMSLRRCQKENEKCSNCRRRLSHCQVVRVRWKKSRRWSRGQESVKTRILVLFMMWTTFTAQREPCMTIWWKMSSWRRPIAKNRLCANNEGAWSLYSSLRTTSYSAVLSVLLFCFFDAFLV